ncbi:MAG: hypothetical protein HKN37_01485 [Rhodothermales bacterium]|nr:hypothetical protein [Rhodothermales bacterium]
MRAATVRNIALIVLMCAIGLTWLGSEWLSRTDTRTAEQVVFRSLRETRSAAINRVSTTRLVVDDIHMRNVRSIDDRINLRNRSVVDDPELDAGDGPPALGASLPTAVSCAQLIRVDDRLVDNLQSEIEQTRDLLDQYRELSVMYERELDAHSAVRRDYVRKARLRKMRNRTFVAAGVIVTVVLLVDR